MRPREHTRSISDPPKPTIRNCGGSYISFRSIVRAVETASRARELRPSARQLKLPATGYLKAVWRPSSAEPAFQLRARAHRLPAAAAAYCLTRLPRLIGAKAAMTSIHGARPELQPPAKPGSSEPSALPLLDDGTAVSQRQARRAG
jgi:hypothetical protein